MLLAALSAISLATAAAAQVATPTASSVATPTASSVVIQVGGDLNTPGGALQYIPANVTASNGTVVIFKWVLKGNHSVAQSSFSQPCSLLRDGFGSGFVSIPSNVSQIPEWNLTITDDTKPIWFYCQQLSPSPHCQQGFVGALNAAVTGNATFAAFVENAKANSGASDEQAGALRGVGAFATALPSPVPSGVTLADTPTAGPTGSASATGSAAAGTGASSSSTESGSTPSSTSAGSQIAASSMVVLFAAALGFMMV